MSSCTFDGATVFSRGVQKSTKYLVGHRSPVARYRTPATEPLGPSRTSILTNPGKSFSGRSGQPSMRSKAICRSARRID